MDPLSSLQALGLELPSPTYLIGAILFGLIGWAAWRHGRRTERPPTKWIGVALMLYPYVISSTWLLYGIGLALCVGLVLDQRPAA
jgi:hypothetical protein